MNETVGRLGMAFFAIVGFTCFFLHRREQQPLKAWLALTTLGALMLAAEFSMFAAGAASPFSSGGLGFFIVFALATFAGLIGIEVTRRKRR